MDFGENSETALPIPVGAIDLDVTQDPSIDKKSNTVVACAGELAKRELCRIELQMLWFCSPTSVSILLTACGGWYFPPRQ